MYGSSSRSLLALLLVALAGVSLAGCTERQSEEQYINEIRRADTMVRGVVNQLVERDIDDVTWFAEQQRSIRRLGNELDSVNPPRDLDQPHDAFVRGTFGLARLLGELADCGRKERVNPGSGIECRRNIQQARLDEVTNDLEEARTVLRAQGYELEG